MPTSTETLTLDKLLSALGISEKKKKRKKKGTPTKPREPFLDLSKTETPPAPKTPFLSIYSQRHHIRSKREFSNKATPIPPIHNQSCPFVRYCDPLWAIFVFEAFVAFSRLYVNMSERKERKKPG